MLGEFSETRKTKYVFKIEYLVEEGMNNLRHLDRRPPSRIYRIGVTGEKHIYYVTTEAQTTPNLILSTLSWVECHALNKKLNIMVYL